MITGQIDTIAFGGKGILRDRSHVIFVPFAAPQDQLTVRIVHQKKRYAEAEILHIDTPSPLRIPPRCPYFGACGGCQLQHLNNNAQAEAKRQFIQDAFRPLRSYQSIEIPPIETPSLTWGYRQHIRLKLQRSTSSSPLNMGYTHIDNHSFVPIQQCPIFHLPRDPILHNLFAFLQMPAWAEIQSGHVRLLKTTYGTLLLFFLDHLPPSLIDTARDVLARTPSWAGIIFSSPSGELPIHLGQTECRWELPALNLSIQYSPFGFIQNHPEQSTRLYQFILDQIPTDVTSAFDVYCGVGITSLLLGKRGIVTLGIESHADTVQWAKRNAAAHKLEQVTFYQGKAEEQVPLLLKQHPHDLILLNPPRIGLHSQLIHSLLEASPKYLIYVSCMPPTLARDLSPFLQKGYSIKQVRGFDLFPQTTHVETVVLLEKKLTSSRCL